jgi:protocatechuate 3,4-dioxygenase beta subunit
VDQNQRTRPTRRDFVRLALAASGSVAFAVGSGCGLIGARSAWIASGSAPLEQGQELPPTPECVDDDDPTPAQTEGPYFTPSSPERSSLLEPGLTGTKITVRGYVLTTDCQAAALALLDFWQADDSGEYDNIGYRLRGHQFADEAGRYSLETIVPGLYPGRTRHFHVKVQAPGQPALTTQLYFPSERRNQSDGIFHPALLMDVQDTPDGSKLARFDFVLPAG